jgi:hypothetical protein
VLQPFTGRPRSTKLRLVVARVFRRAKGLIRQVEIAFLRVRHLRKSFGAGAARFLSVIDGGAVVELVEQAVARFVVLPRGGAVGQCFGENVVAVSRYLPCSAVASSP